MSHRYETEADILNERKFLKTIEDTFCCEGLRLPVYSEIDCILAKGKNPIAFAELKCRTATSTTFPTIILSAHKLRAGMKLSKSYMRLDKKDIPFIFAVRFRDKDMYCKVTQNIIDNSEKVMFEATNNDKSINMNRHNEWCAHIPICYFKEF